METRPPTWVARLVSAMGWGARIPKPSGPHLVRSFHFRIPGDHGVLSQVFFPVNLVEHPEDSKPVESTVSVAKRVYRNGVLRGFSYFSSTPKIIFDLFLGASPHPLADVPAHAKPVTLAEGEHSMPWIIFSHGLGGNCEVYTKTCSDLASYGYIVVALEHEDGSGSFAKTISGDIVKYQKPPEGMSYSRENVINFRAPFLKKREQEIRRAVDYFTSPSTDEIVKAENENKDLYHCLQSVHPTRIFLAGHSFGAASTVHTIRAWPGRFIGAILMDLWPFPIPELTKGVSNTPICSILSASFESSPESFLTMKLLQNSNQLVCNFFVPGSVHSSFSDTPFWAPAWVALKFGLRGALDPEIVQKSFNDVYVAFMQHVLEAIESKAITLDGQSTIAASLQDTLLKSNSLMRPLVKTGGSMY